MISTLFHAVFYNPIYNALVALVAIVPWGDVGIAVIILTLLIRLLLLPLSLSAARTQRAMKVLEPRIKDLKEKHKGNKEAEALETLSLYKEAQINPFASVLTALIQIPVLLALYWVFRYESFAALDTVRLYPFTPLPHTVSLFFLGLIAISGKSIVLAVLAGITQFVQARLMLAGTMKPSGGTGMQADFQKVLGTQLQYVFPLLIAVISYTASSAVALYFVTTNIAGSLQELHVRRTLEKEDAAKAL
jgi:YidC/Oxa1 family membrane protein insertase